MTIIRNNYYSIKYITIYGVNGDDDYDYGVGDSTQDPMHARQVFQCSATPPA